MNTIKLRQIKYHLAHHISPANVVLIIAVIVCLTCTYNTVVSMSKNWELSERLNAERQNLELAKIAVETAELENAYYETPEYQELAARKLLNKQLEGEHMVYLPENSDAAKRKHSADTAAANDPADDQSATAEPSNFSKWMQYLFP